MEKIQENVNAGELLNVVVTSDLFVHGVQCNVGYNLR